MDSTTRSKENAHEKVKLEPYGMSLKKVLIVPNEGGVPLMEVKHQQGVQIKREYMIPYTSQEVEVGAYAVAGVTTGQGGHMHMQALYAQGDRVKDDSGLPLTQERSQYCCRSWSAGCPGGGSSYRVSRWMVVSPYVVMKSVSWIWDMHQWSSDAWWPTALQEQCQNIVEGLRVQMEKTMLVTFSMNLWRKLS
eukprot:Gb_37854 [translate_table: standard]